MENNVITDIRIPFWRLVFILVKLAVAAIPAAFILIMFYMLIFAVVAGIVAMFGVSLPIPKRTF
jgi:hypothetical protein